MAASNGYQPKVVVETAGLSEQEWLEYRRKGIGGSDAAAVLGVSPFATARDLYYDKLNIVSYGDDENNWVAKEMGHLLEDLVAKIFAKRTGFRIYQIKKMFYHPAHPFMLADIDYFVELPDGETAILEIKTTNYNATDHWWRDGKEVVPVNYEIQGRHYMCVMNLNHVYYCCLYGNKEDETLIRHLTREPEYEEELIALEENFWNNHVLAETPPPYVEDGSQIIESVKRRFGPGDPDAQAVELGGEERYLLARYLELQSKKRLADAQAKEMENEMKRLQGRILAQMGASRSAVCSVDGSAYTVTYNPYFKSTITKDNLLRLKMQRPDIYEEYVTASESRRFTVKQSRDIAA